MGLMARFGSAALLLPFLLFSPAHAQQGPVGAVKILYGEAVLIRHGTPQTLQLGVSVFEGDHLETREDGHIGITFRDSTRISIGPSSQLDLSHVVFAPEEKRYSLVLRLLDGTLDYLSGMTAKLAPDAISIQTPASTIAVRGTHLLIRARG